MPNNVAFNFIRLAAPQECTWCLDEINDDALAHHVGAVFHAYHDACIRPWLTQNRTCPECRANVTQINGQSLLPDNSSQEIKEAVLEAARRGDFQHIRGLLHLGPHQELHRVLAIMEAHECGHREVSRELLNIDPLGPLSETDRGFAVIRACARGPIELATQLVTHGPIAERHRQTITFLFRQRFNLYQI